jgi:hypothetical protein
MCGPMCHLSTHVYDKLAMSLDPTKDYTATIKTAKGRHRDPPGREELAADRQ